MAVVILLVAAGALAVSFPLGAGSDSDAWLVEHYHHPDSKFPTQDGA
jgi:hypothetical protein